MIEIEIQRDELEKRKDEELKKNYGGFAQKWALIPIARNIPYVAVQITSTTQKNYETEKREEIRTEKRMKDEKEYDKLLLIFITRNTESENTFIPDRKSTRLNSSH